MKRSGQIDFALEDQLLAVLHAVADRNLMRTDGVVLVNSCKVQVGMIIPDLLVITGNQSISRREMTVRRLTHFDCAVLAELLNCGPSRCQSIAAKLYAQPASLDRTIKRLMRWSLVLKKTNGTLAARRGLFPPNIQVISVEAKLRRWKDALCQARKYLTFSNSAFVALPEMLIATNSRIRPACAAEGVGLLSVNPKGASLLLRAKRKKIMTADWVWLISKTIGLRVCNASKSNRPYPQSARVTSKKRLKACNQPA